MFSTDHQGRRPFILNRIEAKTARVQAGHVMTKALPRPLTVLSLAVFWTLTLAWVLTHAGGVFLS